MNTALIPIVGPKKITKRGGELVIKFTYQKFTQTSTLLGYNGFKTLLETIILTNYSFMKNSDQQLKQHF